MINRRGALFVNALNTQILQPAHPDEPAPFMTVRGIFILTDFTSVAGERYIRGLDLKLNVRPGTIVGDRFSLQFAVVPDKTNFPAYIHSGRYQVTYPMTQDTIYVTTLHDAYENGVKIDGLIKGVPKGYYLVCFIWETYGADETELTTFGPGVIDMVGRVNISF